MNEALITTIENQVKQALAEDIGSGDLTALLIDEQTRCNANLIAREEGIFCGREWFATCFHQLDKQITIDWQIQDGEKCHPNQLLCKISGSARNIFTAERSAMNFVQTLSATATITSQYVAKVQHTNCKILDTRKTLPGFRLAQKYAVLQGGGHNHRIGLFDAILIKENHIGAAGSITNTVQKAQTLLAANSSIMIEVEVENLDELDEAIKAGCKRILLDNFTPEQLKQAVQQNQGRCQLEASGNITLDNIKDYAETGVDYISVGAITKHINALDLSLRIE